VRSITGRRAGGTPEDAAKIAWQELHLIRHDLLVELHENLAPLEDELRQKMNGLMDRPDPGQGRTPESAA
jgi:hypothetical protein